MKEKYYLDQQEVDELVDAVVDRIRRNTSMGIPISIAGVPRGGIPVAYLIRDKLSETNPTIIASNIKDAMIIVDDLIDSGSTAEKVNRLGKPFMALIDKRSDSKYKDKWIVFPWEGSEDKNEGVEDNVRRIIQYYEPKPEREGIQETPARVAKAFDHWMSGYNVDIEKLFKVFQDGGEDYDQMVLVKNIPIYSKCEHHMADIFGTADIAYIPDGKVVGLSKLSRVADAFARRLQVQERLTQQIADAIQKHLSPIGVGVRIRARHMCMESRGICQQGHHTVTTAFHGALKDDINARQEFLGQLDK